MHFAGPDATSHAGFGAEQHLTQSAPQYWVPYPSPSQYPLSYPASGPAPPHLLNAPSYAADSYPGRGTAPLPPVTYQRALPPVRPHSKAANAVAADLRHPKSYYARFRNLPSLTKTRATPSDKGAEGEITVIDDDGDRDEDAEEYSDDDATVKRKKKGGKRGVTRVKRHRKTLSCEPCRRKKIRCDRNLNCGPCHLRGMVCTWAENSAPNVPRDPSAPASNPHDVHTIEHLRGLIRQLGGRLSMDSRSIDLLIEEGAPAPVQPAPRNATATTKAVSDAGDEILVWPSPVSAERPGDSDSEGSARSEPASVPTTPASIHAKPGAPSMVLGALDQIECSAPSFFNEFEWYGAEAQAESWGWGGDTPADQPAGLVGATS